MTTTSGSIRALPSRCEVRLDEQVERIRMFPESGAFLFEPYRLVLLMRYPYIAVFVARDDHIEVLAVIGVHRDPAWVEATVSERGDEQAAVREKSARSPAETDDRQRRPTLTSLRDRSESARSRNGAQHGGHAAGARVVTRGTPR